MMVAALMLLMSAGCERRPRPQRPASDIDPAWAWLPPQGLPVHSKPDKHVVLLQTQDPGIVRWQAAASTSGWWLRAHRRADFGVTMRFDNRQGQGLVLGSIQTKKGMLLSATSLDPKEEP